MTLETLTNYMRDQAPRSKSMLEEIQKQRTENFVQKYLLGRVQMTSSMTLEILLLEQIP